MSHLAARSWSEGAAAPLLRALMSATAADHVEWMDLALCAETDPDEFFPPKGGTSGHAKRVCMACPVRAQCLEYALEGRIAHGIWGGKTDRERKRILRQRAREAA